MRAYTNNDPDWRATTDTGKPGIVTRAWRRISGEARPGPGDLVRARDGSAGARRGSIASTGSGCCARPLRPYSPARRHHARQVFSLAVR